MTRNEKEKITKMLEKNGIEVIRVRRNKALVKINQAEKWIDLKTVDETSSLELRA